MIGILKSLIEGLVWIPAQAARFVVGILTDVFRGRVGKALAAGLLDAAVEAVAEIAELADDQVRDLQGRVHVELNDVRRFLAVEKIRATATLKGFEAADHAVNLALELAVCSAKDIDQDVVDSDKD